MAASAIPSAAGTLTVTSAARLQGVLHLPGDKSISHRALMLGLLADGETRIRGAGDGADVRSTAAIVRALGAEVERRPGEASTVDYVVRSGGSAGLRRPDGPLDCGNSGTSLRLFAGILAGQLFDARLDGDGSLRSRPMARIIDPLRSMGASIEGSGRDPRPPLDITGRRPLRAIDWTTPIPSAQVKSAILLAALAADGRTIVRESVATRDHTERMLRARGVPVASTTGPGAGTIVEIKGGTMPIARDELVPGDPSAAAFWLVAAAIHPHAELRLERVGVNPTRRAIVDLLRRMAADISEVAHPAAGPGVGVGAGVGEPIADLAVRSSALRAIDLDPADTAAAIDEVPILCLAATQAEGRTTVRGAGELRHKESDRLAAIVDGLSGLGARIAARGDDIVIEGPTPLHGATVDSLEDHRLAMTFAIAGLIASGRTSVRRADSAAVSYPAFAADLERIRA